ncbi:MAG: hypothetical protein ABIZ18_02290 [Caldimonas sp.]
MSNRILACIAVTIASQAQAQALIAGQAREFPSSAVVIADAAIRDKFEGKTYRVDLADGSSWRLDYKSTGYYFVNTSTGFSDSGKWRIKDGQICTQPRKGPDSCNDVRDAGDATIFVRRMNGDVIQLKPQ